MIDLLLDTEAGFNGQESRGQTNLHVALRHEHLDVIPLLLHHMAEVNIREGNGWQPIHEVAQRGFSLDIIPLFINRGADPNSMKMTGYFALCILLQPMARKLQ